jgi:excisionase family DNA binding protein
MKESIKQGDSEYLTTGMAAQYCGVSYVTVLRWIHKGYLPAFRLPSGHYRIIRGDFDEFLTRHNIPTWEFQNIPSLEPAVEGIKGD